MGCQLQQNTSERIKLENIYIHILREQYQQTFLKQKSTDYLRLVCMSGTSAECWIQELTALLSELPRLPPLITSAIYHSKPASAFGNNALITSFLKEVYLINFSMHIPPQESKNPSYLGILFEFSPAARCEVWSDTAPSLQSTSTPSWYLI